MTPGMLATMDSSHPALERVAQTGRPVRVALLCDFLEEQWPSMDLTGELLDHSLGSHYAGHFEAVLVRPDFHRRLMRLSFLPPHPARNVDRVLNRFIDYPRALAGRIQDFDLFHIVDHSYSQLVHVLPANRTVVTCHDLDTFRCLLDPGREKRSIWFRSMTRKILQGFRQAAHVICNSEATRRQLIQRRVFSEDRLTVIHNAVHPDFSSSPNAAADAEAARLLRPSSPEEIRLLSVGSTIPRKRMDVLLQVFSEVRKEFPTARLIRVGGPFTDAQSQLARELGAEPYITQLPFLSREVLAAVYRQAALLLMTSEAEGFGWPVTEAMACGCPVLASDLDVLREVGGSACEYCPVGDVPAWASAIARQLDQHSQADRNNMQDRRQRALAQVARYSELEHARKTVEVYQQVLKQTSVAASI